MVSRGTRHHVLVAKDDHPRLHSSSYPHVKMDKDDAKAAQQKETRMTQLQADVPSDPQRGVSSLVTGSTKRGPGVGHTHLQVGPPPGE